LSRIFSFIVAVSRRVVCPIESINTILGKCDVEVFIVLLTDFDTLAEVFGPIQMLIASGVDAVYLCVCMLVERSISVGVEV